MPYEFAGSMLIYFTLGVFKREDPDHPFKPSLLIATFLLFLFTPRIACFLFGYFFAEIYHRWKGPIERWKYCELFFGIMAIIPVILSTLFNFGEHDQYISLLALMLVTAATFFTPLRNFLNTRVSRFMGRISFPLYLVHIILICSLSSYLLLKLPRQGLGLRTTGYIDAAATILCSLLLACVFLPVETLSVSASKQIAKKLVAPFKSRKVLP
jgi:peptidoglycan/LPS O-acetylase OafA/YrhL